MTRINVVSPAELYDQHLLIELRELPRMFTYIENHASENQKLPDAYTMGAGHMKFFANKAAFLYKRMFALYEESVDRGFNFNFDVQAWVFRYIKLPDWAKQEYTPDDIAREVNRQRLKEKLELRPGFYRYLGEKVD